MRRNFFFLELQMQTTLKLQEIVMNPNRCLNMNYARPVVTMGWDGGMGGEGMDENMSCQTCRQVADFRMGRTQLSNLLYAAPTRKGAALKYFYSKKF